MHMILDGYLSKIEVAVQFHGFGSVELTDLLQVIVRVLVDQSLRI